MQQVFKTINDMVQQGILSDYALGGSVAFMVWSQPFLTNDTDFFVQLPQPVSGLLSLSSIYGYAADHGFETQQEHIVIDGEPVQILPSPGPLYDEAIVTAATKQLYGQPVKVMLPEYLVCTALQAGRMKDWAKIEKLLAEAEVDLEKLAQLISKFGLDQNWRRYQAAQSGQEPPVGPLARTSTSKQAWRRMEAAQPTEQKLSESQHLRDKSQQYLLYRSASYRRF
jgi:hypothetical protein